MPAGPTGWRGLVVDAVAPGWAWWPAGSRRRRAGALALLAVGTAFPLAIGLYALFGGRSWLALSLDAGFLLWLTIALACAAVVRVAWCAPRLWTRRGDRRRLAIGTGALLALALPLSIGAVGAARARTSVAPVFTPIDTPVFDGDATIAPTSTRPPQTDAVDERPTTTTIRTGEEALGAGSPIGRATTTTVVAPLPERPRSGVDPATVASVRNVLVLGGDAGPGRSGLRTDTIMLLSVDTASGRAGLVSLPRDLRGLLFPPGSPLEARHPYGFSELANAVYPIVSSDAALRDAYAAGDIRPGVFATAQAVGYSLDVTIHDYVLIDMEGFVDLIDAVGGVTVDVRKELPMPGNIPGADTAYPPTIGPGTVQMTGTVALGYVRSRYADSDYQRTARQRELVAALARQVSFSDVVARFGEVTSAVGGTLRTSLTPDELAELLAIVGGETAIVESVGLVPPLVNVRTPDFQHMAEIVGAVRVALATGTTSGY